MLALVALVTFAADAKAQLPETDIWLSDVSFQKGELKLGLPVNVTQRPGYDNQPCFLSDGSTFLFTRADSTGSEIFHWNEEAGVVRITRTAESEYSPTPLPGGFCTVRVEADSTQRLWRFDIDGSNPRVMMSEVDSVGYFAWIDDGHVAVFVLGNEKRKEPHTLRVVEVASQRETIIAHDIGRAIHRVPGTRKLSFVVHEPDDTFRFLVLNPGARTPTALIDAIGSGQDAAWLDDRLLMASGAAIHAARPFEGAGWRPIADFSGAGIVGITRIAVAPDHSRIAFVAVTR
jgi:dipeptidyl aminopeptidase/acylaminoacyl peptidase